MGTGTHSPHTHGHRYSWAQIQWNKTHPLTSTDTHSWAQDTPTGTSSWAQTHMDAHLTQRLGHTCRDVQLLQHLLAQGSQVGLGLSGGPGREDPEPESAGHHLNSGSHPPPTPCAPG